MFEADMEAYMENGVPFLVARACSRPRVRPCLRYPALFQLLDSEKRSMRLILGICVFDASVVIAVRWGTGLAVYEIS